ncbi:hypothetical protein ACFL59_11180, partial [Planctomycetota bacterium]
NPAYRRVLGAVMTLRQIALRHQRLGLYFFAIPRLIDLIEDPGERAPLEFVAYIPHMANKALEAISGTRFGSALPKDSEPDEQQQEAAHAEHRRALATKWQEWWSGIPKCQETADIDRCLSILRKRGVAGEDRGARKRALDRLVEIGPASIPALAQALDNEPDFVQLAALTAIRRIAEVDGRREPFLPAIPGLIGAVRNAALRGINARPRREHCLAKEANSVLECIYVKNFAGDEFLRKPIPFDYRFYENLADKWQSWSERVPSDRK